jgi:GT2 family glycosyltransferase
MTTSPQQTSVAKPTLSLTVGICTLDRYPYVHALLDDLAAQTRLPDEVLIVDQTAPHQRQDFPVEKWRRAFPVRVIVQTAKGTTKARNGLLRDCKSDILLMCDDDVRLDPAYVAHHLRHFADSRVDAVSGPVYEWDAEKCEWYVKWENHFMLSGPSGPAFPSVASFSGGNSSIRLASALAIGGWDENIVTYGEDNDFRDRLDRAGAVCIFDPQAGLRHLRAARGGERDHMWDNKGFSGNWHVLAGVFYFYLRQRPLYSVYDIMIMHTLIGEGLGNLLHARLVGLRILKNALIAAPVSFWRWCRGPLLIDPDTPDRRTSRFSKREVSRRHNTLALRYPRTVLPDAEPPELV